MFDSPLNKSRSVALIEKQRPEWQKGKLNGIGGKVEDKESSICAMIREFDEETGVQTKPSDWTLFCEITFPDAVVLCYRAIGDPDMCETKTDEDIDVYYTETISDHNCVENLAWLIPLGLLDHPVMAHVKIS